MPSPIEPTRARRASLSALVLLVAILVTGCTGGPGGSDATASPTAASRPPTPSRETDPSGGPSDEPPSAVLASPGGDATEGELGGYTWAGAGSDAPWLVPPPADAVRSAGPYSMVLDPTLAVDGWTARWARVVDGGAGDPSAFADGGAGRIVLDGPPGPGSWSLQVDVRFAGGGRAAWYWRVDPAP